MAASSSSSTLFANVDIIRELDRLKLRYKQANNEVIISCPFHKDGANPNCYIHLEKKQFHCRAAECNQGGDVATLLAFLERKTRAEILADLGTRYSLGDTKTKNVEVDRIEAYHNCIWAATALLAALAERGVDEQLIRQYRLGEHEGRVTIPIKDEQGLYVNIRSYLPGASGKDKMRQIKGFAKGNLRLYPIEQLKFDRICLCGGEMKAIVAARELNPYGIGAISSTGGEGIKAGWHDDLLKYFKDKEQLWVTLDIDDGGIVGAQFRAAKLHSVVKWLGVGILPLDKKQYPKGDINDFVAKEHGDLFKVLEATARWEPPKIVIPYSDSAEPKSCTLTEAMHAENAGERITLKVVVSSMDQSPYAIPKTLSVKCSRSEIECGSCPIASAQGTDFVIPSESPALLEMVNETIDKQTKACMHGLGVPVSCKSFPLTYTITDYYNAEDTRIDPLLEITQVDVERKMQPALCVGRGLELNTNYQLIGRMHPHPKTQKSTLLISQFEACQDSLSTYTPTQENLQTLKTLFQPAQWTVDSIAAKLHEIYTEFENHVTRIFCRKDILLMTDLAYHSILVLNLDGRETKGWVEVLIIGDSSCGKSETVCGKDGRGGLAAHYGVGEKVSCKQASLAGLLGGVQRMGDSWFATWGKIPSQDRRLIILEELKGMSHEVFGGLTDMRSSGIAEVAKICQARANSRVRIIAVSNAPGEKKMASYPFGVEAIMELCHTHEDTRRFDAAIAVSENDIDTKLINELQAIPRNGCRKYLSEPCRELILWCWTRSKEQVIFEPETLLEITAGAIKLTDKYASEIPIVDKGSIRQKLARLSAALAARTFSVSEDNYHTVIVRPCHVQYIVQWLDKIYSSKAMGYDAYSDDVRASQTLADPDLVLRTFNNLQFATQTAKSLLNTAEIMLFDIENVMNLERGPALDFLSFMIRQRGFIRKGRSGYRKTPALISLLKEAIAAGKLIDRPAFQTEGVMKRKSEF